MPDTRRGRSSRREGSSVHAGRSVERKHRDSARREQERFEDVRQGSRRRARSIDQLSPLRHHENRLLPPRRQSADSVLVTVLQPGMIVDPNDPGRIISSAGSTRSLPPGTRSLDARLLALLDEQQFMEDQYENSAGAVSDGSVGRVEDHGCVAPAGRQRPSTPLAWGKVELGAYALRQRHAAKLAKTANASNRPQSAIEIAESALDGQYRQSSARMPGLANPHAPSESTAAPPEREVAKRVHELYHSARGKFEEVDTDDKGDERESVFQGTWITHNFVPTKRGNQRRAGVTEATPGRGKVAGLSMAEMMAAAVKAQQEEEDLEYRTGMSKEMRAIAAKQRHRLQRERKYAQHLWRKRRLAENLGEGMAGEWQLGIETDGDQQVRRPLQAARLAARDRRRAKQASLRKRLSTHLGRAVARAMSR